MRYPWVNTLLLAFIPLALITGYLGLTNGHPGRAWLLWLHANAGYSIAAVAAWKIAVVRRSIERKPIGSYWRPAFLLLGGLTAFVLVTGVAWAWLGPSQVAGTSLMTFHGLAAAGVALIFGLHVASSRVVFRVKRARDRRAFLRLATGGVAGLAIWQAGLLTMRTFGLPGARRRFTGSYEQGSGTGDFPAVSWIADGPDSIDAAHWRLRIDGHVTRVQELTYRELRQLAPSERREIIDCTGGWYSEQQWTGVSLWELIVPAQPRGDAGSVTITSVTGYGRRFSLDEAKSALLAFDVAGAPLDDNHGFPARLVVPGHRGFDWVKWVERVTVNEHGDIWQSPLPLQ